METIEIRDGQSLFEVEICCSSFKEIFENGSDNEGYGGLGDIFKGVLTFGSIDNEVQYCPWCGTRVSYRKIKDIPLYE